jgi:hypothetical protein
MKRERVLILAIRAIAHIPLPLLYPKLFHLYRAVPPAPAPGSSSRAVSTPLLRVLLCSDCAASERPADELFYALCGLSAARRGNVSGHGVLPDNCLLGTIKRTSGKLCDFERPAQNAATPHRQ